jgi:hypothetical protein
MSDIGRVYEFVYRGHLADAALDAVGRPPRFQGETSTHAIAEALSLDLFEPEYLEPARQMAVVYMAIAAFENGVRRFVSKVLLDAHGDNWWQTKVSDKIRKFAESRREDEEKTKWHGFRGDSLLSYTELGQLANLIQQNWPDFEPYIRRLEWASSIFSSLERSRNVIMHSGILDIEDIERVGIHMRDWIKQVGL